MAIIPQKTLFSWENDIKNLGDLERLRIVMEYMPDEGLMRKLEDERGKGRDDYPVRGMWNAVLAGVIYQHPSAESLLRELKRNGQLRWMCGFMKGEIPTTDAISRYLKKVMEHQEDIDKIFDKLVELLIKELPGFGKHLAIDSKGISSLSRRYNKNEEEDGRRDIDADKGIKTYRGRREDGTVWKKVVKWFGYKLHLIVDSEYELPVGYIVSKASSSDVVEGRELIRELEHKHPAILSKEEGICEEISADKAYDAEDVIVMLWDEYGVRPIIDIRNCWQDGEETKQLPGHENIVYDYTGNVYCYDDHGKRRQMVNGGFDRERQAIKKLCPVVKGIKCSRCEGCKAKSGIRIKLGVDRRIFTPIDRTSYKWKRDYKKRTGAERVNSRLDEGFGFEHHYIRGIKKMKLKCSLALIVMLTLAYGRIKEKHPELMRSLVAS